MVVGKPLYVLCCYTFFVLCMCVGGGDVYSYCSLLIVIELICLIIVGTLNVMVQSITRFVSQTFTVTSLDPTFSWLRGKESLVMTACACANPYQ